MEVKGLSLKDALAKGGIERVTNAQRTVTLPEGLGSGPGSAIRLRHLTTCETSEEQ
jgi:hypothetical protein